jgi:hypothetical protein
MRLLVTLTALAAGCLPAYDNMFQLVVGDGGGSDGDAGNGGSGRFLSGVVASFEDIKYGQGAIVHIDGYPQPQFTPAPADATGKFRFEIPQALVDSKEPRYLVVDGTYLGLSILKTWDAPKRIFDGGPQNMSVGVHFYKNQDDQMGARGAIATALQQHGDIPSATGFAASFSLMIGYLYQITPGGERDFRNYTVQLTADGSTLDNTNCKPATQCCVYYASDYPSFKAANPPQASIIDFTATSSPSSFVVVCPGTQTGEITLTQTAPLSQIFNQTTGVHPTQPFQPVQAPRVAGDGVLIEWPAG